MTPYPSSPTDDRSIEGTPAQLRGGLEFVMVRDSKFWHAVRPSLSGHSGISFGCRVFSLPVRVLVAKDFPQLACPRCVAYLKGRIKREGR